MRDETENLILTILKEIQARTKGLDDRMANLELRLTAQEQDLGTLVLSLPPIHDRLDALTRRMERVESRLELRDVYQRGVYSASGLAARRRMGLPRRNEAGSSGGAGTNPSSSSQIGCLSHGTGAGLKNARSSIRI
jgi:uncharacterized coiled-coil protein SlyX